jgi:hypothetical protein
MKTVIYQNTDGYDIVRGFGDAALDPVATNQRIADDLMASDEAKTRAVKHAQIEGAYVRVRAASQASANAHAVGDRATEQAQAKIAAEFVAEAEKLMADLPAMNKALDSRRQALIQERGVYFTPGGGQHGNECLCTDAQVAQWRALEKPGYAVSLGLDQIPDNCGVRFWTNSKGKWSGKEITKLGETVPEDAILDADLSDTQKAEIGAQLEVERVKGLSPEAKIAEATVMRNSALASAQNTQAQAVIKGKGQAEAVTDAQAEYAAALEQINEKYGQNLE